MKILIINISIFCIGMIFLVNCDEADVVPKEYPYVETQPVIVIPEGGVRFSANIVSMGTDELVDYGFVWGSSNDPTLKDYHFSVFNSGSKSDEHNPFTANITWDILSKQMYVRGYAQSEKFLVYGSSVKFVGKGSKPVEVIDFFPKSSRLGGNQIHILGRNFSSKIKGNKVALGDYELKVLRAFPDSLIVLSPPVKKSERLKLKITAQENTATSSESFELIYPWQRVSNFPGDRRNQPSSFTIDGFAYVGGGAWFSNYKKDFYRYDPANDSWSSVKDFPGTPRYGTENIDEVGIIAFGRGSSYIQLTDAWQYDPIQNEWTEVINESNKPVDNFFYNVTLIEGNSSLYAHFYTTINEFWKFNIDNQLWTKLNSPNVNTIANVNNWLEFSVERNGHYFYFSKESVWSYNPISDIWSLQSSKGVELWNFHGALSHNQLYLYENYDPQILYEYEFENYAMIERAVFPKEFLKTSFSVNGNIYFGLTECSSCPIEFWKF